MGVIKKEYLGVSTPQHIHHDLHDSLMHAQSTHQVGVLIEYPVAHDVPDQESVRNIFHSPETE